MNPKPVFPPSSAAPMSSASFASLGASVLLLAVQVACDGVRMWGPVWTPGLFRYDSSGDFESVDILQVKGLEVLETPPLSKGYLDERNSAVGLC